MGYSNGARPNDYCGNPGADKVVHIRVAGQAEGSLFLAGGCLCRRESGADQLAGSIRFGGWPRRD